VFVDLPDRVAVTPFSSFQFSILHFAFIGDLPKLLIIGVCQSINWLWAMLRCALALKRAQPLHPGSFLETA